MRNSADMTFSTDEITNLIPNLIPRSRNRQPIATYRHLAYLLVSSSGLALSGYLLSSTTSSLAVLLGLTQSTAGLTILSISTTLPEKLVAFKSARKQQAGILVANTVGSNIFLLTLVLGVVWVTLEHIPLNQGGGGEWTDVLVVLASCVVLFGAVWGSLLKRSVGLGMFGLYIVYIVVVLMR